MNKSLVLVTGSAGLIGSALCKRLARSFRVIGMDKEGSPYPPKTVEWIFVDLTSDESVMNALHVAQDLYGGTIASVCHLAAYYDFSGKPSDNYENVTVRGTQRLMRELKRFFSVQQIIFSSTMLVHAPTEPGVPIDESSPLDPKWDYPKSKVETENILLAEHGDTPLLIMRIAGVYDSMCHSIPIAHQIQRIYERDFTSHLFAGDTEHGQSFVHLDDLIEAFSLAIKNRKHLPDELTLLIGEPDAYSYQSLQDAIGLSLFGSDWRTNSIPKPIAKAGAWVQDKTIGEKAFIKPWMIDLADDHFELDISKAEEHLGWRPERNLKDTIPEMIESLKKDPLGWYRENKLSPPGWLERESA